MNILVINAGSSSLKYQLFNSDRDFAVTAKGLCERIGMDGSRIIHSSGEVKFEDVVPMSNHADAIREVLKLLTTGETAVISSMDEIDAIGHRVLHGGTVYGGSILVDDKALETIERLIPLGPLHIPANLTGILACKEAMPGKPQVAVFDTAFHQTMPQKAYMYALPYEYYEKHAVRRYGFHGTSHMYIAQKATEFLGKDAKDLKLVICHLGNGSSISAVDGGKCVDTTMGLTPLEGLPMGTRSGSIDPAIIEYIMDSEAIDIHQMTDILNKKSGVLGLSGVSSDFRDLFAAKAEGNERAALALDVFVYTIQKYIGSYAVAMNGLDAVVFTAGIGENNPTMRDMIVKNLGVLGAKIDDDKNNTRGTVDISTDDSKVKLLVIPTNEELMIALDTLKLAK